MKNIDIHQEFGLHLKTIRKSKVLTQEDLGEKCGLTPQYIGVIERGGKNPPLATLYRIAKALEVTPAQLLAIPKLAVSDYDKICSLVSETPKKKQKMILTAVRAMVK